jgi:hypothetical protein
LREVSSIAEGLGQEDIENNENGEEFNPFFAFKGQI